MDVGASKKSRVRLRLFIIGAESVGKTSIMNRYLHKKFDENTNATCMVDFGTAKYMTQDGTKCVFKIWDTAGQKRFKDIVKQYLNDNTIDGCIIAFDLTNQASFTQVKELIEMVKNRRKK